MVIVAAVPVAIVVVVNCSGIVAVINIMPNILLLLLLQITQLIMIIIMIMTR